MASARNPLNDFILTPQQQGLLFAALNSNNQPTDSPVNGTANMSPTSFTNSPVLNNGPNGLQQESPFLDYDYDFSNGDTSYDFIYADSSQAKMVGDLPDSNSSDSAKAVSENNDNEKRAHPDDENDEEEGAAKRQETGEKAPKKPGRKPLTTEPTSVSLDPIPTGTTPTHLGQRGADSAHLRRNGKHRTGPLSAHSESGRRSISRIWRTRSPSWRRPPSRPIRRTLNSAPRSRR